MAEAEARLLGLQKAPPPFGDRSIGRVPLDLRKGEGSQLSRSRKSSRKKTPASACTKAGEEDQGDDQGGDYDSPSSFAQGCSCIGCQGPPNRKSPLRPYSRNSGDRSTIRRLSRRAGSKASIRLGAPVVYRAAEGEVKIAIVEGPVPVDADLMAAHEMRSVEGLKASRRIFR